MINPRNLPPANGHEILQQIVDRSGPKALHPNGKRKFTIREAMRLQTFGDNYQVRCLGKNGRTVQTKAIGMIGDAVPPVFMEAVFQKCEAALKKTDEEVKRFVPVTGNAIALDD